MKRLVLMRHAKSDWSMSRPDHQRTLNARGVGNARALGDWLRAEAYAPDAALVSTATRTRETWGLLGFDTSAHFVPALYDAPWASMLEVLRGGSGGTLLMLGHNPGICEFAHRLLDAAPTHDRFDDYPTGATLVADFTVASWQDIRMGTGTPVAFTIPRDVQPAA